MNNKKSLLITLLAVVLTLSVLVFAVFAEEETTYAGSDLPVSESYVLRAIGALEERVYDKIDTMVESLSARIDDLQKKLDTVGGQPDTDDNTVPQDPAAVSVDYTVVRITRGQAVVGSCEIILRSGTAEALCPGVNGISDLTAGADLTGSTQIDANHLLLIPRDDGRGITVTSNEAYVMVRGTYRIVSPSDQ